MKMLPALAMPFHDPDGRWFTHLERVMPQLKSLFERAYLNITPPTQTAQPSAVQRLQCDPFFRLSFSQPGSQAGDHCMGAYQQAAQKCNVDQVVHLCYVDRLVFILQSEHSATFAADLKALAPGQTPLLFTRSEAAWSAYPRNYFDCEMMTVRSGELLFGRSQLRPTLPRIHSHDFGVQAELALLLKDQLTTRTVEWLAWEDPFLEGRHPLELKRERESSLDETRKRLGYVIPIMKVLLQYSRSPDH
jgi:hypothetical protein